MRTRQSKRSGDADYLALQPVKRRRTKQLETPLLQPTTEIPDTPSKPSAHAVSERRILSVRRRLDCPLCDEYIVIKDDICMTSTFVATSTSATHAQSGDNVKKRSLDTADDYFLQDEIFGTNRTNKRARIALSESLEGVFYLDSDDSLDSCSDSFLDIFESSALENSTVSTRVNNDDVIFIDSDQSDGEEVCDFNESDSRVAIKYDSKIESRDSSIVSDFSLGGVDNAGEISVDLSELSSSSERLEHLISLLHESSVSD